MLSEFHCGNVFIYTYMYAYLEGDQRTLSYSEAHTKTNVILNMQLYLIFLVIENSLFYFHYGAFGDLLCIHEGASLPFFVIG